MKTFEQFSASFFINVVIPCAKKHGVAVDQIGISVAMMNGIIRMVYDKKIPFSTGKLLVNELVEVSY